MRPLTLVYPYFDSPQMLEVHYRAWAGYSDDVKAVLTCIVVDDCSQGRSAVEVLRPSGLPELRIYRVKQNVPWAWDNARNLAMQQALDGWALLTDIDHELTAENARAAMTMPLDTGCIYMPARKRAPDDAPWKRHPNSWLMTREMFWRIGGYDLRFMAVYGKDSIFRRRAEMYGKIVETDAFWLRVYNLAGENIGGVPDAGAKLQRKEGPLYVANNPELSRLKKTAHLERPADPVRLPWSRVL